MDTQIQILLFVFLVIVAGCRSAPRPPHGFVNSNIVAPDLTEFDGGVDQEIQQVAYIQQENSAETDEDAEKRINDKSIEELNFASPTVTGVATDSYGSVGTQESIEALALSVSPAIKEAEAKLEALKGKHLQAGLPPNPTIGISGEDINEDGSPGRYGVYYGRTLIRGNKLGLSQKIVCEEINAAEFALIELQQRLVVDVRLRYYELLIAIEKTNLASQLLQLTRNAVEATGKLLEAKEVARTALLQAELEFQNAEVTRRRADNDVLAARRNLATLIGEEDLPFASFSGNLEDPSGLNIESAFDRIASQSPEIARLFAEVDVTRRNLARQRAEPIGDVTWQTSLAYDLAGDDFVTAFQVGVAIPKYNRNQGAICQAKNRMVAAENAADKKALEIRDRLVASFQSYTDAKLQVDAFNQQILPKARESLELISEGYRQGEVGFLELLTAQRTFFQFNLSNIEQLRELWRQRILIEGMLLSGSLE